MNVRNILEAADRILPLTETEAVGRHSITLYDGKVCLTLWARGKGHSFTVGPVEESVDTPAACESLITQLKALIDAR